MAIRNYGVMNTGSGTITAKQMAIGRNPIAISAENIEAARQKLDQLLEAVQVNANKTNSQDQVRGATKAVVDEFLKEKPSAITLKALLNEIAAEAQPVESITSAARALKTEITNFL